MNSAEIQVLARRLRTADPSNSQEQREIFEKIREIRGAIDGPFDPESQRSLEAASMLVAYLARMGTMAGDDVRSIAARLLDTAYEIESGASALAKEAQGAGHASAPPTPGGMRVLRSTNEPNQLALAGRGARAEKAAPEERTALDAMGDMMLGQILLRRGQILEEHIHQAVKVQRTTGMRLGDIFVKIGAASRAQVADALNYQASCRRARESAEAPRVLPKTEPSGSGLKLMGEVMLGEILIERGVITRRQLERALEVQKAQGLRIGEALVRSGAASVEHIEHALRLQSADRRFATKPGAAPDKKEPRR